MKNKIIIFLAIFLGGVFITFNQSLAAFDAAYISQCENGTTGGAQTGCTHDNDRNILNQQCKIQYPDSTSCNSMPSYLAALSSDCDLREPDGIDCVMIKQNGFYGREASKFAQYKYNLMAANKPAPKPAPAPMKSSGCGGGTSSNGDLREFANPLCYNSLSEVLIALLSNLQSLMVIIAIIFIVIGGMMYMFSGANEKLVEKAKSTIGGALIGLAIILAAPSFLKEIKTILGGDWKGENADEIVNQAFTFKEILISILNFLLSMVGILGIIGLVIGGAMYLTAYGSDDRVESAKKIITGSLLGIIIAFAALIVIKQLAAFLGIGIGFGG